MQEYSRMDNEKDGCNETLPIVGASHLDERVMQTCEGWD
jgi:hypothetical protein